MEGFADGRNKMADLPNDQPQSASTSAPPEALSKNAFNREAKLKAKQKEEEWLHKDKEKKKKAAAAQSTNAQKHQALDREEEDMDPTQYLENRLKVLATLKSTGVNPYPHKFLTNLSIPDFIKKYQKISKGEHLNDEIFSLAGRIMSKRSSGTKLNFYDLHADGAKVQVMADLRNSGMEEADFVKHHAGVKCGDIVGICGFPACRTFLGENVCEPILHHKSSPDHEPSRKVAQNETRID